MARVWGRSSSAVVETEPPMPLTVRLSAARQAQAFCDRRIPAFIRGEMWLDVDVVEDGLVLMDCRSQPVTDFDMEPWTRRAVAKFRYRPSKRLWDLWWC